MIADILILFFATLLVVGQGRVALGNLRVREAGWGKLKFAQSTSPKGFWAMAWLDILLFAALCVWLWIGARQLLS